MEIENNTAGSGRFTDWKKKSLLTTSLLLSMLSAVISREQPCPMCRLRPTGTSISSQGKTIWTLKSLQCICCILGLDGEQLLQLINAWDCDTPSADNKSCEQRFCCEPALPVILDSRSWERIHNFNMNINTVWFLFGITMKAEHRAVTTLTFKSQVWLENTGAGVM